jgi:YgiT-type zinc finger domain-containing protein
MECIHCHGTLERGHTSYTVNRKGYHLIIDNVLAWICAQCGEALFDEETVKAIQWRDS